MKPYVFQSPEWGALCEDQKFMPTSMKHHFKNLVLPIPVHIPMKKVAHELDAYPGRLFDLQGVL